MGTVHAARVPPFAAEQARRDFPVLERSVNGRPLVYLDSAASAQKPRQVIDAEADFYRSSYANVHRGVHTLSQEATAAYEGARETTRRFLGASEAREVVFVRGTTEAVNLVAQSFVRPRLERGDEVLITGLEHHSNIVPWQIVCEQAQAKLAVAPINERGEVEEDAFAASINERTRFCSFAHVSNALGTVNPVAKMVALARDRGVPTFVDGAQAAPHLHLDVAALDCDFYAFSAHKLYAPTGVGVLYGRAEHLDAMPPYQGGGEMIRRVTFAVTEYAAAPHRFEAGTPNIAGVVGLAAAIEYFTGLDADTLFAHEDDLVAYTLERLKAQPRVRLVGEASERLAVVSFVVDGIHAHDLGTILDRQGIAVRAGHHCAQPVMDFFGVPATVRASFGLYNTRGDVDRLLSGLEEAAELFR